MAKNIGRYRESSFISLLQLVVSWKYSETHFTKMSQIIAAGGLKHGVCGAAVQLSEPLRERAGMKVCLLWGTALLQESSWLLLSGRIRCLSLHWHQRRWKMIRPHLLRASLGVHRQQRWRKRKKSHHWEQIAYRVVRDWRERAVSFSGLML